MPDSPQEPMLPSANLPQVERPTGLEPALPGCFTIEGVLRRLDALAARYDVEGEQPTEPPDALRILDRMQRALFADKEKHAELLPAIVWLANRPDPILRRVAVEGLSDSGPGAIPALIVALSDSDARVRHDAAYTFRKFCGEAADAVPALVATLSDEDSAVRSKAAVVFWNIGPVAAGAIPALITGLSDPDSQVRICCAFSLGNVAPTAVAVRELRRVAATDPVPRVREKAEHQLRCVLDGIDADTG